MVERVLAPADVQGVAVGQERLAAALTDKIRDGFGPVRPEIGEVARLAEMDLDGGEFLVEINGSHARGFEQAGQLLLKVFGQRGAEVREIDLGLFHDGIILSCLTCP